MLTCLQFVLAFLARAVLKRYGPKIVAVAGSIGKTSTTRAIAAVLARAWPTRAPRENHNNEIGVPLTILGEAKAGGRSLFAWAGILWRGFFLAFGPACAYPKVLVLEMATDRPGDLQYLISIAQPDIAVLTSIAEEHTEFLGSLDEIAKEEGTIVRAVIGRGIAVLNADDVRVAGLGAGVKERAILFGFAPSARVRAERVVVEAALGTVFTRFDLLIDGVRYPVNLSDAIGEGNVYAALAAASVGVGLGLEPAGIPYGLAEYQSPLGRLRALPGISQTTLIDDTYNSSPRAADMALRTLALLPVRNGGRRVAVLGDMLELGALTETAHRDLGRAVVEARSDMLIGVGPAAAVLCAAAREAGMPDGRVHHFDGTAPAGHFLREQLQPGDLVLIKGSRGMHMEQIVRALMAEPERAEELLVH